MSIWRKPLMTRASLAGLFAVALSGCDTDLSSLINPTASVVAIDQPFAADNGSDVSDAARSVSASFVGQQPDTDAIGSLSATSIWDTDTDAVIGFEDAVRKALDDGQPLETVTACDWRFGFKKWEFVTHCGLLLEDGQFPKVQLDQTQRDIIKSFEDVRSTIEIDFDAAVNRFTVTFDGLGEAPDSLELALFGVGVSVYEGIGPSVHEASQYSFHMLYVDGQRPLELEAGTATTVNNNLQAVYTLSGSAEPLTRISSLPIVGRAHDFASSLTTGGATKRVRMTGVVKFNTEGTPHPSKIKAVDYDITIGDLTLKSTD